MFGARSVHRVAHLGVLLATVVLASVLGFAGVLAQSQPNASQGTVRLEWLGHEFYRLTSPEGVVVLTSPWLTNADGARGAGRAHSD